MYCTCKTQHLACKPNHHARWGQPFQSKRRRARCPQIVARALELVSEACADTGRNQVCYGHIDLTAIPQPTASDFTFQKIGDITRVNDLTSLTLKPMNEEAGTWGVALMRLQANIPDTLPGQNVTFVLFGDASILPAAGPSGSPMQAFFLRTGIGDAPCAEAPSSGLLVQTPEGVGEVVFNINGVDISIGSTILLRSMTGEEMTVSALEGAAVINVDGTLYPVVAGTWTRMSLGQISIVDRPILPIAYVNEVLEALPVSLLERPITPREPFTPEELEKLYDFIRRGAPPAATLKACSRPVNASLVWKTPTRDARAGRAKTIGASRCPSACT
jgi:hypothetical protein